MNGETIVFVTSIVCTAIIVCFSIYYNNKNQD